MGDDPFVGQENVMTTFQIALTSLVSSRPRVPAQHQSNPILISKSNSNPEPSES